MSVLDGATEVATCAGTGCRHDDSAKGRLDRGIDDGCLAVSGVVAQRQYNAGLDPVY